jgi:hypothetical protein
MKIVGLAVGGSGSISLVDCVNFYRNCSWKRWIKNDCLRYVPVDEEDDINNAIVVNVCVYLKVHSS